MSEELVTRLNALLRAERAGVRILTALAADLPRGYLRNQMEKVRQDARTSCAGLSAVIRRSGGVPRRHPSRLAEQALAKPDPATRLWLYVRTQAQTVREVRALLHEPLDGESVAFLEEMLAVHEQNFAWCNQTVPQLMRERAADSGAEAAETRSDGDRLDHSRNG